MTFLFKSSTDSIDIPYISWENYTHDGFKLYDHTIDPFSPHSHNFATVTFIDTVNGICEYHIDHRIYPVKPGDILLINSDVLHFKTMPAGSSVQEIHLGFRNFSINDLPENHLSGSSHQVIHMTDFYADQFRAFASSILLMPFKETSAFYPLFLQGILYQLLSLVYFQIDLPAKDDPADFSPSPYNPISKSVSIVQSLHYYIETHYMENIFLSDFAQDHFISLEYLGRSFKKEYGITPLSFLTGMRIQKARELLEHTDYSIKTISEMVGYQDPFYFSKLFKCHVHMTPKAYRKHANSNLLQ